MAWRDTGLEVKFLGINGSAIIPMNIYLLHMTSTTFYLALGGVGVFIFLQYLSISPMSLLRMTLHTFSPKIRHPIPLKRYSRRVNR